jgi:elongation factor Ts
VGVLLEVNCETDFVARGDTFREFVKEVSMQIAAMNPLFVTAEEMPVDVIAKEREILTAKAKESGKPDHIVGKMVDGQIAKWQKEQVLLEQTWVKDDKKSIKDLLQELISKVGENCKIRRFVRFELGEGLEKRKDDFAAEVAKQAGLT